MNIDMDCKPLAESLRATDLKVFDKLKKIMWQANGDVLIPATMAVRALKNWPEELVDDRELSALVIGYYVAHKFDWTGRTCSAMHWVSLGEDWIEKNRPVTEQT